MPTEEAAPPGYKTPIPAKILTPDSVETRIGRFEFADGFPSADTAARLFDNLDFIRDTIHANDFSCYEELATVIRREPIPAGVPAKDCWSVVAYDPQARSELQTGQPYPSRNSQRELSYDDDGSIDIPFGPGAPAELERNWIETGPGKDWFTILRLYGPLEPWFDRTWIPGDLERSS